MHILAIVLGTLVLSAGVAGLGLAVGFSGWAAFGLGAASFGAAQVLYLGFIAGMARAERLRRQSAGTEGQAPAKPAQRVVQKG